MLQRKLVSKQSNLTQNVVQGFTQEILNAVLCDAHPSFGFTYQLSLQSLTLTVFIT